MKKRQTWSDELDIQGNLHRRLPRLANKYLARGRQALIKGRNWKEIHEFRLATKRLRYTFELFAEPYGSALDKPIEQLKHVQTMLGDANDCLMTAALIENVSGAEEIQAQLKAKADSKLKKLRAWWSENFVSDSDGQGWLADPKSMALDASLPEKEPDKASKRPAAKRASNSKH